MDFTEDQNNEIQRRLKKAREDESLKVRKKMVSIFSKNSPELKALLKEFSQEAIYLHEFKGDDPSLQKQLLDRYIKNAEKKGLLKITLRSDLSGHLRSLYEKNYLIYDKKNYAPPRQCPYCKKPILNDINTPITKYCSHRCKLLAYYERRNKAKGIKKTIETHIHCLICGKSLEGKRAGTKTCSMSCRKSLSLKKKIISSRQEQLPRLSVQSV